MNFDAYLGMELDLVLNLLCSSGNDVEILYTVPPRSSFSGKARVLKVYTADDKVVLTVSYQMAGKGV